METEYNEDSPPRNVKVSLETDTMVITWENNCPMASHTPTYVIQLTELTLNNTDTYELKHSGDKQMSHTFSNIHNGAIFNVSISTKSKNAQSVVQKVYAPALPAPRQLTVYPEKNGTYVVYWKEVTNLKEEYVFLNKFKTNLKLLFFSFRFTYQLVVVSGMEMNDSMTPILTAEAKTPPIFVNPFDLGGTESAGKIFTMGVRVKTDKVNI